MNSLSTTKEMPTLWSEGTPLVPYFDNLSASSFPGIIWCPDIHIGFDPFSFSNACIPSRTRTDSVVIFGSTAIGTIAAIDVLLSEQIRYTLWEFSALQN